MAVSSILPLLLCSPAAVAWSLHRSLGFPLDLIDLMLEERSMTVDKPGLEQLAAEHEKVFSFRVVELLKVQLSDCYDMGDSLPKYKEKK